MPSLPQDDSRAEAAVWQAMVLFSTLSMAATVWHDARERRAGHDPSTQEGGVFVLAYLRHAAGEMQALLMQLQAGLVQAEQAGDGYVATLVHRYNELMSLRRVTRYLKVIHQRLLSLYPDVDEVLVDEARFLEGVGKALIEVEEEALETAMGMFIRQGLVFAAGLNDALW